MKKYLILVFVSLLLVAAAQAVTLSDTTQSNFTLGTFSNTFYNTTAGSVQVNGDSGTFTSRIMDAGSLVTWNSLLWNEGAPYGEALPDVKGVESVQRGVSMANNVLLMHFEETSGAIADTSGSGNSGVASGVAYSQLGTFGSGLGFSGEDVIAVPNDPSLNPTTAVSVEAWIQPQGAIGRGALTTVEDSFAFDGVTGLDADLVAVSSGVYAVAYAGPSDVGFLKTLNVSANGNVENVIDTLEFDANTTRFPDLFAVTGNVYGIAYRGVDDDGFVKTVQITADGQISDFVIDVLEFDSVHALEPYVVAVSSSVYAIGYQGYMGDGFITTIEIDAGGHINDLVLDSFEFDTQNGKDVQLTSIAGDVYAVVYRGNGDDGFLKTLNITSSGAITSGFNDVLLFDSAQSFEADMEHLSGELYAIAYRGADNDGYVSTVRIASDGTLRDSLVDTLEFDTSFAVGPDLVPIDDTLYAISYRGVDDDGFVVTLEIASDGTLGSLIDTIEYEPSLHLFSSMHRIAKNVYALLYTGPSNNGLLKTLNLAAQQGIFKEGSYGMQFNSTTLVGSVNNHSITTALGSGWQHVVFTYDTVQGSALYVNGELHTQGSYSDPVAIQANPLFIGAFFNGTLDEVAVYTRALSATEVFNHYLRGRALNISVRACDDSACAGDSWSDTFTTPNNTFSLTNRYFQYKVDFASHSGSPELYNVSVHFLDTAPPEVTNVQPSGSSVSIRDTVLLSADVTDHYGVASVEAELVLPNGSVERIALSLSGSVYNASYVVPDLGGRYNITLIAKDNDNNVNATERGFFTAQFVSVYAFNVTIEANQTTSTLGNVSYLVYITNLGSVADTFDLSVTNVHGVDVATMNQTTTSSISPGDSVYVFHEVGDAIPGNYSTIVTARSNGGHQSSVYVTTNVTPAPNITQSVISQRASVLGDDVEFYIASAYTDSISAVITLPNGSVTSFALENEQNTTFPGVGLLGRYNVTYIARDFARREVTLEDYFTVFTTVDFNVSVVNLTGNGLNSTFAVYYEGQRLLSDSSSNGVYLNTVVDTLVDLLFTTFDGRFSVLLRGVNVSSENNKTLQFDTYPGIFLSTFAADHNYSIINATVTVRYDNLNFTNESLLEIHQCGIYNFSARDCLDTYYDLTSSMVQSLGGDTLSVSVENLSSFGVQQGTPAAPTPSPSGGFSGRGSGSSSGRTPIASARAVAPPSALPPSSPPDTPAPVILFDIKTEILESVVELNELLASIKLINLGDEGEVLVNVTYNILDDAFTVVYEDTVEVSVETQKEYIETFDVGHLVDGAYVLHADLHYAGQTEDARSESPFTIDRSSNVITGAAVGFFDSIKVPLLYTLGLLLALGLFAYSFFVEKDEKEEVSNEEFVGSESGTLAAKRKAILQKKQLFALKHHMAEQKPPEDVMERFDSELAALEKKMSGKK